MRPLREPFLDEIRAFCLFIHSVQIGYLEGYVDLRRVNEEAKIIKFDLESGLRNSLKF